MSFSDYQVIKKYSHVSVLTNMISNPVPEIILVGPLNLNQIWKFLLDLCLVHSSLISSAVMIPMKSRFFLHVKTIWSCQHTTIPTPDGNLLVRLRGAIIQLFCNQSHTSISYWRLRFSSISAIYCSICQDILRNLCSAKMQQVCCAN